MIADGNHPTAATKEDTIYHSTSMAEHGVDHGEHPGMIISRQLDRIRNKTGVFDYENIMGDDKEVKALWDKLDTPESSSDTILYIFKLVLIEV
jgi:hypothetical protein